MYKTIKIWNSNPKYVSYALVHSLNFSGYAPFSCQGNTALFFSPCRKLLASDVHSPIRYRRYNNIIHLCFPKCVQNPSVKGRFGGYSRCCALDSEIFRHGGVVYRGREE